MQNAISNSAKQPVVRPGQKTPYHKGTRQQIEERTQAAALLLFLGLSKTQIHRLFREKFNVQWRQCDRYLTRARANAERLSLGNSALQRASPELNAGVSIGAGAVIARVPLG